MAKGKLHTVGQHKDFIFAPKYNLQQWLKLASALQHV